MTATHPLRSFVTGAMLGLGLLGSTQAQLVYRSADAWPGSQLGAASTPARAEIPIGCGPSLLPCKDAALPQLAAEGNASALRWNVELAQLPLGPADRLVPGAVRQGLNLSLVGRKPLFGSAFSVYGKLGATYGYGDSALAAPSLSASAADGGYGVSFGAGLSMEVTPRLSATLGWDSHELRLGGGTRDAFRATSLGLQYRY